MSATLFEPGPIKLKALVGGTERDAELLGYVEGEHTDFLAVVRVPGELFLVEVHPSRVRPV